MSELDDLISLQGAKQDATAAQTEFLNGRLLGRAMQVRAYSDRLAPLSVEFFQRLQPGEAQHGFWFDGRDSSAGILYALPGESEPVAAWRRPQKQFSERSWWEVRTRNADQENLTRIAIKAWETHGTPLASFIFDVESRFGGSYINSVTLLASGCGYCSPYPRSDDDVIKAMARHLSRSNSGVSD